MASASAVTSALSAEDGSTMQVLRGRCFFMRVGY